MRVLASMLEDGEQEVWANQHYDPSVFKGDPGGIVYHRWGSWTIRHNYSISPSSHFHSMFDLKDKLDVCLDCSLSRECNVPDWSFDSWHPWEKVQYMDFFEKREGLKADFHKYYEDSLTKKYQEPNPAS